MPTGKFLPSGLWTTEESWFNSQNALVGFSTVFGLALGFAQLVLGANGLARKYYHFHSVWKRQMHGVLHPLRHTSSGNGIKIGTMTQTLTL